MEYKKVKRIENPIILQGVVMEDARYEKERSRYLISTGEKEYVIMSKGKQAVKDNLFVRKGQHMEITGCVAAKDNLVITPERARILLDKVQLERSAK